MALDCIANAKLEDTGFNYTMSLIQGKLHTPLKMRSQTGEIEHGFR